MRTRAPSVLASATFHGHGQQLPFQSLLCSVEHSTGTMSSYRASCYTAAAETWYGLEQALRCICIYTTLSICIYTMITCDLVGRHHVRLIRAYKPRYDWSASQFKIRVFKPHYDWSTSQFKIRAYNRVMIGRHRNSKFECLSRIMIGRHRNSKFECLSRVMIGRHRVCRGGQDHKSGRGDQDHLTKVGFTIPIFKPRYDWSSSVINSSKNK